MIQLDKRGPVPFSSNPFGLVYENAITENKENEVQIHPITYQLNGIKIATNIYTPKNYSKDKQYPAIVIAVPNGAVKEQAAGLYGQRLAEKDISRLFLIVCSLVKVRANLDNKIFLIIV